MTAQRTIARLRKENAELNMCCESYRKDAETLRDFRKIIRDPDVKISINGGC